MSPGATATLPAATAQDDDDRRGRRGRATARAAGPRQLPRAVGTRPDQGRGVRPPMASAAGPSRHRRVRAPAAAEALGVDRQRERPEPLGEARTGARDDDVVRRGGPRRP